MPTAHSKTCMQEYVRRNTRLHIMVSLKLTAVTMAHGYTAKVPSFTEIGKHDSSSVRDLINIFLA